MMDEKLWLDMMQDLSIGTNLHTFEQLQSAYSEQHRYYHTATHIDYCLALFNEYRDVATNPSDVQCAIWFHDAIYNPMSKDNELKSADWATQFLNENGCTDLRCDRVRNFILATIHDAPATDPDTQLLVDIDLAILGADDETYREFEDNVRREYKWVPGPLFRRERRKILRAFLDRNTIYSTKPFHDKYESHARINIQKVLKMK